MADYYSQRALAAKSQTESSLRASSQRQQMEMSQQASSTVGGGSVQQVKHCWAEFSIFFLNSAAGASWSCDGGWLSCFPHLPGSGGARGGQGCVEGEVPPGDELVALCHPNSRLKMEEKCSSQTGRGEAKMRHSARF